MNKLRKKFLEIEKEMNNVYFERKDVIRGLLVGLLARQHVLLLGPPGTAKSEIVEDVCSRLGGSYFRWLVTRFSVPEELFGPVSLKALEQDCYKRITSSKLPEANVVFLDEVFKGSSSILNTLLTCMNERMFFNDGAPVTVPLEMLVGASNELPEDAQELGAIWDRFLLRYVVSYIKDKRLFENLLSTKSSVTARTTIAMTELADAQSDVGAVDTHKVISFITAVRDKMNSLNISVSDRRWRQLLSVIKAHAWLEGRTEAADDDLVVLAASLWQEPGQITQVRQAILELVNPLNMEAQDLIDQAMEIYQDAMLVPVEKRSNAGVEANQKLVFLQKKLKGLSQQASEKGKSADQIDEALEKVEELNRGVVMTCMGIKI
jgi:MoxR-like ATPase